jgi:two-component system, chemotaxis family, protein-glutamate methylesterase/glutaminase
MLSHNVIVIGASAGGVETLIHIVKGLPPDFPAPIFIVSHFPPQGISKLPEILSRAGNIAAVHAQNGEVIQAGRIYVAPPDYHLLIQSGTMQLNHGPTENRYRPAIDPLFRSVAEVYGERVIGIILSGMLDDGTAGLVAIKAKGGIAIVQDPSTAVYTGMLQSAIDNVKVDYVLPVSQIPPLLVELTGKSVEARPTIPLNFSTQVQVEDNRKMRRESEFACPTCGGVLWHDDDDKVLHFRCRVRHAFSPTSLLAEQTEQAENALFAALRAFEERKSLLKQLINRVATSGNSISLTQLQRQKQHIEQKVLLIQQVLDLGVNDSTNWSEQAIGN